MSNTTHNTSTGDSGLPVDPQHITCSLGGDEASPKNASPGHIADRLVRDQDGQPAKMSAPALEDLLGRVQVLVALVGTAYDLIRAEARRRAEPVKREHPDWPEELAIHVADGTHHLTRISRVLDPALAHLDGAESRMEHWIDEAVGDGTSPVQVKSDDWSRIEGEVEQARGLILAAGQELQLHGEDRSSDYMGPILMLLVEASDFSYQLRYSDLPSAAMAAGLEVEEVFAYMDAG